jgi:uncharacterized membrane protein YeiH
LDSKDFLLPLYFDYSATFLWAVSGALLGARRGYAILGIITVAVVSSVGGGILRDGFFIQDGPPVIFRTPGYLSLIGLACLLVMLFGGRLQRLRYFPHMMGVIDAVGLGAYAVVGMNRAVAAGISLPGVVFVGMVNSVGGGILRDILIRKEPSMFKPGTLEESLALVGCVLFVILIRVIGISQYSAAWTTIVVVFVIRLLAIRYQISSRPLKAFQDYWDQPDQKR